MPLKTVLYLGIFGCAFLGSIMIHPVIGVYGYLLTYNINPLGQWWGNYLPGFAERYALLFVVSIALGMVLHHAKLKFDTLFERQEILLILFVAVMWLSTLLDHQAGVPYNLIKMSKVLVVLLMASHIVTTRKLFDGMLWVLILAGFFLSYEIYTGEGSFRGGRFHSGVGGSDFGEGNFLAAHFAFLLPFVGVMLLKSGWAARAFLLASAVFIVNGIAIVRSRGTFLALGVGVPCALVFTAGMQKYRKAIVIMIVLGLVGAVSLTDQAFWTRMSTLQAESLEWQDTSVRGRLLAWKGAWQMSLDHPLGVGVGQFFYHIGSYQPEMENRDAHNTYLRCLAELGIQGLFLLMLMIYTAFSQLRKMRKQLKTLAREDLHDFQLYLYACNLALIIYLIAAIFITSVYIEEFYWLLMMPVFLQRALASEIQEVPGDAEATRSAGDMIQSDLARQ